MTTRRTGTKKATSGRLGSVVRALAPVVPLAIALAHPGTSARTTTPSQQTTVSPAAFTRTPGSSASSGAGDLLKDCASTQPCPELSAGHPVRWFFVFKFNSASFPGCQGKDTCPFGGTPQTYALGQHYAYASDESPSLKDGGDECLGATKGDPVSATFAQVYGGKFHYVMWNDQPYGDPNIASCSGNCSAPWAHSKGVLAWNDAGEGFVMQVTTPNWPISGGAARQTGNSLGCLSKNVAQKYSGDNVELSQHFFAVVLSAADVVKVLTGLVNAGVATDKSAGSMMISNGGPGNIQQLVSELGTEPSPALKHVTDTTLDAGVEFFSKSSGMDVPPWQFVSAELGGVDLRVATFYDTDPIPSTQTGTLAANACWNASLNTPGAVASAKSGSWVDPATGKAVTFGLGGTPSNGNHAKIGVTTSGTPMAIFGDENQQGALTSDAVKAGCSAAQNGRGGTFYVVRDANLAASIQSLIGGATF